MPHTSSSEGFLRTADRALVVLAEFTEQEPEHSVSELARRVGLDKSQVQRLLKTLVRRDFLTVDSGTKTYRLGPALIGLGRLAERSRGVDAVVRVVLRRLARDVGESAVFNVPDGNRYRCAVAADQPRPFRYSSSVGQFFPGTAGASGHAIFAHYPPAEIEPLFEDAVTTVNSSDSTDVPQLLERYVAVREAGYAVSFGEHDPGVVAVSAPVFAQAAILGSVTVLGAAEHVRGDLSSHIGHVRTAAGEITARFDGEAGRSA